MTPDQEVSHIQNPGPESIQSAQALTLSKAAALPPADLTSVSTINERRITDNCNTYTVRNRRTRTIIATDVHLPAARNAQRRKLLGRDSVNRGTGLWIAPCEAIHTFWLLSSIDAVFLERNFRVRALKPNLRPFTIALCMPAYSVLELPPGTIRRSATVVGDYFEFVANFKPEQQSIQAA